MNIVIQSLLATAAEVSITSFLVYRCCLLWNDQNATKKEKATGLIIALMLIMLCGYMMVVTYRRIIALFIFAISYMIV